MKSSLSALLLACALSACQTVPDYVPHFEDPMGAQTWAETMSAAQTAGTLVTSGKDRDMVQRVGARVAAAATRRFPASAEYAWEFALISEPVANAWALPGGKSAVYTGLLPVTQDEQSLAMVLGHEVSHVLLRHGAARITNDVLVSLGVSLADVLAGNYPAEDRELVHQALGAFGSTAVVLPFSRSHETEADLLGLELAADAGYDPHAAVTLWERMAALGGERPPEILSTHPSEETRIARLQKAMPKAEKIYAKALAEGR
ncbi:MAG: M48 family metallopeptidase [Planctomycetes bacterium]|nr:M48 family metallopeptidase [Planctomycetota bacterium]